MKANVLKLLVAALLVLTLVPTAWAKTSRTHASPLATLTVNAPQAPVAPEFNGLYALSYEQMRGDLKVCAGLRTLNVCLPVVIDSPLTDGQCTEESFYFLIDDVEQAFVNQLGFVPVKLMVEIEELMMTYLIPEMVSIFNERLNGLPALMDLVQNKVQPQYFNASFTSNDGALLYGIGELQLDSGIFKLIPDYVQGNIDPTLDYSGKGDADFPIRIEESVAVAVPWGTETISVSAAGTLGATFVIDRQ